VAGLPGGPVGGGGGAGSGELRTRVASRGTR
jgi:hypothetical protein